MIPKGYKQHPNVLFTTQHRIPPYAGYYKPVKGDVKKKNGFQSSANKLEYGLIKEAIMREKINDKNQIQSPWADLGIPGLEYVVDKQRGIFSRGLWAAIVLACLSICAYQIFTRIWLFLHYPVAVDIVVRRNYSMKFPQITICPTDTDELVELKTDYMKANPELDIQLDSIELPDLVGFKNLTAQQIWEKSKISSFNKLTLQETEGRDETYALSIKDKFTINGVCKVINIMDEIRYCGITTELRIVMNASTSKSGRNALWVTLEMDGDQPNFKSKLPVAHGNYMGISIKIKQFQAITTPIKPCVDAPTSINCFDLCLNKIQTEKATCKLPFMKRNHHQMCKNASEARKSYEIAQQVLQSSNLSKCDCRPKCYNDLYTSTREIFGVNQPVTTLMFYYSANQIEIMQESLEYPLFSMLCDVGGNLGLYLSLSIVSLFEIFESLNQI